MILVLLLSVPDSNIHDESTMHMMLGEYGPIWYTSRRSTNCTKVASTTYGQKATTSRDGGKYLRQLLVKKYSTVYSVIQHTAVHNATQSQKGRVKHHTIYNKFGFSCPHHPFTVKRDEVIGTLLLCEHRSFRRS